jgi:hypothetical protein
MHIVDRMLELAEIKKTGMLYDMAWVTDASSQTAKHRGESDSIDMNGYEC